jgi:hypothetical protein
VRLWIELNALLQSSVEPLSTVLGAKSDLKAWEKKIPPPKELLARLTLLEEKHASVFELYPKLLNQWINNVDHVRKGCLSDPPEISLIREDKNGKRRSFLGTPYSMPSEARFSSVHHIARALCRPRSSASRGECSRCLCRSFTSRRFISALKAAAERHSWAMPMPFCSSAHERWPIPCRF